MRAVDAAGMASMSDAMHVAFASDDRGVDGLVVAACSVLEHAERPVHLWVIEDGIDVASRGRMQRLWLGMKHAASVNFVSQRDLPRKVPTWWARSRWPISAASRFQLPEILPLEAKRCIYLDIDILVGTDLGPLFDIDLQGFPVAMVQATELNSPHDKVYIQSLGLDPDRYCNSGVLLMDLDAWRTEGAAAALIDMGRRMRPDLWFFDQDMLNTYFKDRCLLLDSRWNYRDASVHPQGLVQHFAGSPKPWNTKPGESDITGFIDWHKAHQATGFVRTPVSAFSLWKKQWRARLAGVQRRAMMMMR